jgi:Acetyltransferase (GNAT) family
VLVLRSPSSSYRRDCDNDSKWQQRQPALIRAWTVRSRYRGKGIGTGLLETAVMICQSKGWDGPVFDDAHANSARVLPAIFNGRFDAIEASARKTLERVKLSLSSPPGDSRYDGETTKRNPSPS